MFQLQYVWLTLYKLSTQFRQLYFITWAEKPGLWYDFQIIGVRLASHKVPTHFVIEAIQRTQHSPTPTNVNELNEPAINKNS